METYSALVGLCEGNPSVTVGFPSQRPVTQSFDVFFNLLLNNDWAYKRGAGDLKCNRAYYDVTVMDAGSTAIYHTAYLQAKFVP